MPLGSPNIISHVTQCSETVRVVGQFTNSRVRIVLEGDPIPVGDETVHWSDARVAIDRTRLVVGKKLVATQEFSGETSAPSPKGQRIDAAKNGVMVFRAQPFRCGRSVLLGECSPGAKIVVRQSGTVRGTALAVGESCRIDFDPGQSVTAGMPLVASQTICTSPVAVDTTSDLPKAPPTLPGRKLPMPRILVTPDDPLEECERLATVRELVPGAILRLFWNGAIIYDRPCPLAEESVFVGLPGFALGDEIAAEQEMVNCELRSDRDVVRVKELHVKRPRIDGPLCAGAAKVTIGRLKPGATVRVFADGTELGRWEAPATSLELDLDLPSGANVTAEQSLCSQTSPRSRPYGVAGGKSGRWFRVEDLDGDDMRADAFAVHVALVRTGQIVLFSGDQHNSAQNTAVPQDIDHAQLFDCTSLSLQKIDAPTTDAFCTGHAFLPDGRLLVAGGTDKFPPGGGHFHDGHFPALKATWIFNPVATPHWKQTEDMRGGRWYPTLVSLADSTVLALSGHPNEDDTTRHNNHSIETYDSATAPPWHFHGDSPSIVSAFNGYLYPRLHVLPGGDVFSSTAVLSGHSGRWTPGSGVTWTDVGANPAPGDYGGFNHTSVLLPLLPDDGYRPRVLMTGAAKSFVIDLGAAADWVELGGRSPASGGRVRNHCHATILPTAEVLVTGGVENPSDDGTTVAVPELLTRTTAGDWIWAGSPLANSTVVRNYHSTALLMPDGRVWTAGGNKGAQSGDVTVRQLEVEIYEPWYMCAERPVIRSAPSSVNAGQRVIVRVKSPAPIARLALLRCGSATHAFNPDQRYVGLRNVLRESDDLYLGEVPSADIAVPGYYMLFAVTDGNVPSHGVFIRVRP